MKTMTLAIMMLIGINASAKTRAHTVANKNVSFIIELDKEIKRTPYVVVFEEGVYLQDAAKAGQKKIQPTRVNGNTYFFDLKKYNKPQYFSVFLADETNELPAIETYNFEPGDQIRMIIRPGKIFHSFNTEFSGLGSAKYRCRSEMWSSSDANSALVTQFFKKDIESGIKDSDLLQMNRAYNVIENYKPELSTYAYNLLHADVLGSMGRPVFETLRRKLVALKSAGDTAAFNHVAKTLKLNFAYDFTRNVPDSVLSDSKIYAEFLLERLRAETVLEYGVVNYKALISAISRIKNDALRDKLIIGVFLWHWNELGAVFDDVYYSSLPLINDKRILSRLKAFDNNRIRSKAQNFRLADSKGRMVSLSDFEGKVVFIDFWFTGCGACENYYTNVLSKVEERYINNPNIVFITISIDKKEVWLRSVKDGIHTSGKVVNLYTNGERDEHQIIKSYNVQTYPRPMLISKKGTIACVNYKILRNFDGLVNTIEKQLSVTN